MGREAKNPPWQEPRLLQRGRGVLGCCSCSSAPFSPFHLLSSASASCWPKGCPAQSGSAATQTQAVLQSIPKSPGVRERDGNRGRQEGKRHWGDRTVLPAVTNSIISCKATSSNTNINHWYIILLPTKAGLNFYSRYPAENGFHIPQQHIW